MGWLLARRQAVLWVIEPLFLWNSPSYFQDIVQLHHFLSPSHTSRVLLLWCIQPRNLIFHVNWLWIRADVEIVLSVSVRLSGHIFSCLLYLCMVFTFNSFIYSSSRIQDPSWPDVLNNSSGTYGRLINDLRGLSYRIGRDFHPRGFTNMFA